MSVQQPEAGARQGGEDQAQGRGGPRGQAVAVVLLTAGGVIGQAQLVVGLVQGLLTGVRKCATAKVGENPHLAWGQEWALVSAGMGTWDACVHFPAPCTHSASFPPKAAQLPLLSLISVSSSC